MEETKHLNGFSIVRLTLDDNDSPLPMTTEVFVYRDNKDTHDALCDMLEEMDFEYMDAYPDEGTDFNGHLCSYWARIDEY